MDKKTKILLVACFIIAMLSVTFGMLLSNNNLNKPQNQLTNQSQNVNQTVQENKNITTQKSGPETGDSKYITTYCKRCGKPFKQLKDGPGYYYCEECENSPEVQQEWEKETEGTP